MSSPPDSLHDIEDAASKKRGRAQSVEPVPAPKDEVELDKVPSVSAQKKTKRDDECPNTNSSNSVSTIRKNMKDMSTTDKTVDTHDYSMVSDSQEPGNDDDDIDHTMGTINEEGSDTQSFEHQPQHSHSPEEPTDIDSNKDQPLTTNTNSNTDSTTSTDNDDKATTKSFSQFGSKNNGDTNDWSEFADDNDEEEDMQNKAPAPHSLEGKPKYTFGSSSGFGTKGWVSTQQSTPTTQTPSSFSGLSGSTFGSSPSGLGGFSSISSATSPSSSTSSVIKPKSAFGAFANAPTSSPFALAAASGTTNALSSLPKVNTSTALSPGADSTSSVTSSEHPDGQSSSTADDEHEGDDNQNGTAISSFGEGSKIKVPGVKQTEVKTGEEDEDTIYQTKAKLLVLDTTTNNWKERGGGTFRINVKVVEAEGQTTTQSRLVMRADSVYRLILNLLLFAEMKVFIMQDRFVRFAGFESETKEDGSSNPKLVNYALKVTSPSAAQELYRQITSRIPTKPT